MDCMEHWPELAAQPPAHPNQQVFESAGLSIYWRRLPRHKPLINTKKNQNQINQYGISPGHQNSKANRWLTTHRGGTRRNAAWRGACGASGRCRRRAGGSRRPWDAPWTPWSWRRCPWSRRGRPPSAADPTGCTPRSPSQPGRDGTDLVIISKIGEEPRAASGEPELRGLPGEGRGRTYGLGVKDEDLHARDVVEHAVDVVADESDQHHCWCWCWCCSGGSLVRTAEG